jgi:DNA polymerase (family 10)
MPKPDTAAVAQILQELAQRMELEGANPYRARAYSRAAENLLLSAIPMDQLIAEDRLQQIPGVGEALAAVITKIYETGGHPGLQTLRHKIPAGVLEMLRIPGLRPDRVKKLYTQLGIASVAQLEKAARAGQFEKLKGFGPAFQTKALQGIQMSQGPARRHIHRAAAALEQARRQLSSQHPEWKMITPTGEFRRGCELIGPLSLVAIDPSLADQSEVLNKSDQLTVHVSSPERYGITLLMATGSKAHVNALQALARKKGYALTSRGLVKNRKVVAQRAEVDIYEALGLPYIPPELQRPARKSKRRRLVSSTSSSDQTISAASYMPTQISPTALTP